MAETPIGGEEWRIALVVTVVIFSRTCILPTLLWRIVRTTLMIQQTVGAE
jgi:hypothetical protein